MTAKKTTKPAVAKETPEAPEAPELPDETIRVAIAANDPLPHMLPQDHKPKKGKKGDGKLHVEFAGEHWTIDGEVLDDIEFMEAAEANLYAYCGQALLGKQWTRFKDAIRDPKTKRARVTRVIEFMEAAAQQANAKNS